MIPLSLQGISILQLRYFASVVKTASFSRAAIECNTTQATISQHISALEDILGFELFERNNRYVKLTNVGLIFYRNIYGSMLSVENVQLEIDQVQPDRINYRDVSMAGDSLHIGYYGVCEKILLSSLICSFRAAHPGSVVTFNSIIPEYIIEALNQGVVDVAFTSAIHNTASNVCSHTVMESPICMAVPEYYPVPECGEIDLNHLEPGYPFISYPFSHSAQKESRNIYNYIVSSEHCTATVPFLEADMYNALLSVESGLGISLFPEVLSKYMSNPRVRFVKISNPHDPIAIRCMWLDHPANANVLPFVQMMKESKDLW